MGLICCMVGCSSSSYHLNKWYSQLCEIHGLKFGSCICKPPFQLFTFPLESKDPDARRRWIRIVNRQTEKAGHWKPKQCHRVCSLHFNDNEPTSAWPDPTKKLGYELDKSKAKSPRAAPKERPSYSEVVKQQRQKPKRKYVAPHTESMPDIEITGPVDDTVSQVGSEDHLGIPEAVPYLKPLLQDHDYINTTWDSTLPAKRLRPESTCTSRKDIALHDHDYAEPSTSSSENCSECSKKEAQLMEMNEKLKKLEQKIKNLKRLPKRSVSYDIT